MEANYWRVSASCALQDDAGSRKRSSHFASRTIFSPSRNNCIGGAFECSYRWASKALMELFCEEDIRRGALIAVAVTASLCLAPQPAMAEGDPYRQHLMEPCSSTPPSIELLRLGFDLNQTKLAQSPASTAIVDGSAGSRVVLESVQGNTVDNRFSMVAQVQQRKAPAILGDIPTSHVASVPSGAVSLSKNSGMQQGLGVSQLLTKLLQHLGGGGLAGAVGATVVYPLDTIKTRLQAQSKDDKYKDVFDCFRQLLREEGLGSLYNGLIPQLLGIAPEKALKLTVNEVMLGLLEQQLPGARVWALEFIAGGGGGFSQVLVTNPMEIVKLRLQIQPKVISPKGLVEMVQELGLQGLYNGSGITLARDVPSSAIFFACYTLLMQMYPEQRFWAGFLAAIPATLFVTPLDVIKTRLQMETPPGEEPYKDACHCFRVLLQQEGIRGLFKGGLLRVLRTSPQFGITLMLYSIFCDGC